MNTPYEFKTYWSKETPPYGAFDDYIIFESLERKDKFFIRPEEFNNLMSEIFQKWKGGKCEYNQILKEWNESIGFCDVESIASKVKNLDEFIDSLRLITGVKIPEYSKISEGDIDELIIFLLAHKNEGVIIRKE